MMVRTRATTKRVDSEQRPPQGTTIVPSPAKKRRRDGAESSRKRQRGKPGELCQLNLDVLFLIAAYIHPLDLLNLARTCKSLRELLMDKSSAFVWKTTRGQVHGLPDCPADLTEPEYANLVFYTRCHGCGKYAKKVLWLIRRRYCQDCRIGRLRVFASGSCPDIILNNHVLPTEVLTVEGENTLTVWVDHEQMQSFLQEYEHSSDKERFLSDKRDQCSTIQQHASECIRWEEGVASVRRADLESRRKLRDQSIFERLKHHGYEREVAYFGHYAIRKSRESLFKTSKPLTDKEWARMWPEWVETMNNFRSGRLEHAVYQARRNLLISEYFDYVTSPPPNTPAFDLLPHVIELSCFPPFLDVIKAPEGTQMGVKPFESAFAQLPGFVDEWRMQLDVELAELVKIPSHLSLKDAPGVRGMASSARVESSQAPTDKLRLACAVFNTSSTLANYPDVYSTMHHYPNPIRGAAEWERTMAIQNRFSVQFLEDAPYIVHACGLDPNVATVEDMDRRNARLKCLLCNDSFIRTWRDSLRHAFWSHSGCIGQSHFEAVSDKYINAIQTVELSVTKEFPTPARCLLCRHCAGDSRPQGDLMRHLIVNHDMERDHIKQGVHYMPVGMRECLPVEMVEEGGQVSFKMFGT